MTSKVQIFYQTGTWPGDPRLQSGGKAAFDHYGATLRSMNALDYGSILTRVHELLLEKEVLDKWRAQIRYVLVDEIQDSDEIQFRLHQFFAPPASFFAVGDPRQTIYGWRGARPDLMDGGPRTTIYQLTTNFRSARSIIDCGNEVIRLNKEPNADPMVYGSNAKGDVWTLAGGTEDVADLLRKVYGTERPFLRWSDFAVLCRHKYGLKRLATVLSERAEIPFRRIGSGFDVCETPRFKELHSLLRLLMNDRDEIAARRVLALYEVTQVGTIRSESTLLKIPTAKFILDGAGGRLPNLKGIVGHFLGGTEVLGCARINDLMAVIERNLPTGRAEEWDEALWFWLNNCAEMWLRDALAWFATRDGQDELAGNGEDLLTLATIHAAKGLEWPVVILLDVQEGSLPSSRALRHNAGPESLREERRIAYVGVTRAKSKLVLHWRRPQDQAKNRKLWVPSRFLVEMGMNYERIVEQWAGPLPQGMVIA